MVLIDFLKKKISGGQKTAGGGGKNLPPWLKSCVRAFI